MNQQSAVKEGVTGSREQKAGTDMTQLRLGLVIVSPLLLWE